MTATWSDRHGLDHQRHHNDQRPEPSRRPALTRSERLESVLVPGQILDRNTAVTAMTVADTAAQRDLHDRHRLWPHIQSWAGELGLTAPEAVASASQPPTSFNLRQEPPRRPDHEAAD